MKLKNPRGGGLGNWKTNQVLVGIIDGLNRFFTTPDKFVYDPSGGVTPVLKRNGQTVYLDIQVNKVSESGGVGSGYDTVEFQRAPKTKDMLTADYFAVS